MPIYEYGCQKCGRKTEAIQRVGERRLKICPHCGGPLKKLASAPAIQFKGSGWYVTDYGGKTASRAAGEKSESSEKSDGSAKGDSSEKAHASEKSSSSEKGSSSEKRESSGKEEAPSRSSDKSEKKRDGKEKKAKN